MRSAFRSASSLMPLLKALGRQTAHDPIPALAHEASGRERLILATASAIDGTTSGRGSGVVGYNVQVAVDTEHHLIVAHAVTNSGSELAQLANMAKQAKGVLKTETLEAVAERGYFCSPEIHGFDRVVLVQKGKGPGSRQGP